MSKNSYINETKTWNFQANDSICVRCDEVKYRSNETHNCVHLSIWKQSHLKQIMYDVSAQTNYASTDYDKFDENVHSYDIFMNSSHQNSSISSSENMQIMTLFSSKNNSNVNSIICEVDDLFMKQENVTSDLFVDSKSAQASYDKESALNKRSHVKN